MEHEIAYSLYPRGISYSKNRNEYLNSEEYLRLSKIINEQMDFKSQKRFQRLYDKLAGEYQIIDNTCFEWLDRCYNWQYLLSSSESEEITVNDILCLNLSIVHEIYTIYILRTEFLKNDNRLKKLPYRNDKYELEIGDQIDSLKETINLNLEFEYMPLDKLEIIIPDISFQDIGFGKFNLFNAFFLNEFNTKIW